MIEEEVISQEPTPQPPYKKKVFDILSSNFDDFKLGEQDFYKKLATDKNYAGKVHDVLIQNFSDFKKAKNEFIDSLTFEEPLKKKDGGAISSLTELPSEFIEPLKKGINPNKPREESLTQVVDGMIIPTNLPKQDEMRYERELKVQDAAVNTLTDIYKQKGLKFDPSKPAAQKQLQDYITKERDNDLSKVVGSKDGKEYLVRSQGFFESAGESLVRSITNPIESTSINMTNDASDLADLLDDKIKKEPNIPEATPSKISGYLGELGGGLPKIMALMAIPYVGQFAMVGEMYYNALANQRRFLYEKGLADGMDRITSAQNAMKNAPITAIPDAVVATAMARGIGGKGISNAAKESFLKAVGGGLKGVAKVSAVGGFAEFGRSKTQQAQGYKITDAEAIENGLRGAGDYAIMDAAFKLAHAGPKYLSSAAKNVLSSIPKEIVEVAANSYPDGKQTLEEVQLFANTKAKVADFVPESKVASVTGLTEKTNNLKKDIEALEENKKAVPSSVAVEIDNQIKDKNKEIEFYDNQIKKVLNSKDETGISEEIDDVTGEKIGAKKYIVDGEEVSQEAFEALTGKPIGTKEIITAEEMGDVESKKRVQSKEEFDKISGVKTTLVGSTARGEAKEDSDIDIVLDGMPHQNTDKLNSVERQENSNYAYDKLKHLAEGGIITEFELLPNGFGLSFKFNGNTFQVVPNPKAPKQSLPTKEVKPTEVAPKEENTDILDLRKAKTKKELQIELIDLDLKPLPFNTIRNKDGSFSYKDIPDAEYKDLLDKREKRINEINAELKSLEEVKLTEDINKANVTIEGTVGGYKVISGDKANSIGDIRQEANEARAKGKDTFTKETIKDGKKIFTLTDTTVLDEFGRPGFKSASMSFPEGTKVTMEDVMAKLKSELGITAEVKPTEVDSLASKILDLLSKSDKKGVDKINRRSDVGGITLIDAAKEYLENYPSISGKGKNRFEELEIQAKLTEEVKPTEEIDIYDHQDKNAEIIVSDSKWKGQVWRYKFENAGDILRELAKYKNEFLDPGYIYEKVDKIREWLDKQKEKQIHIDDSYGALKEKDSELLNKLKNSYKNQPVLTEAQQKAKDLVLNLIDGNLSAAENQVKYFEQFKGDDVRDKLKEANLYPEQKQKVKPTEVEEIPTDLGERGEPIESTLEAERRRSNGERIFAITEQDGTPVEVTSVEMLRNYTPDQLLAYKPSEIIKNKELEENKLILQNGTKEQGNGKDTGAANGGEMGGLKPSGEGVEVGLGSTSRYVVGKGNRVVRDVTTIKKISIPDSEAAEIKKVLPNAVFDDSFSEINSAEQFSKAISKSLKGNKHSSSVFVYPISEYKNSRLFLTNDGKAGVAITKDGDIISVFSYGEGKNRVAQLLVNAVKDGGVSLDHYDTRLTDIYSQFGFVPVARVKFDRAEAPKTWDYELYKDYNKGEPDVIAMAYNGGDPNTLFERVGKFGDVNELLKKTPYVDTWEQAKKLQQEFVNKVKTEVEPSIQKDIKTQIEDFGVPKEDVEPVNIMLSNIYESLKKSGLTATNTLSEWVGIGKGTKEKGALFQPTIYGKSGIVKRPSFDKASADKAIKSGRVKVISPKKSLEDLTFAITHWDDLFVGDIFHNDKKIGSFDGGVFYPLNGGEKGKMGASVNPQSAGAFATQSNRSLFKNNGIKLPESFSEGTFIIEKGTNKNEWILTNKAGEKVTVNLPDNPKPGVVVIGKGDNLKHKSSLSAKIGFVNTLLSYAKGKEGYDGLINAIKSVYSIGNTRNADSVIDLFNNYLKSGRMDDGQTMSEAKTSYENFRAALIKDANPIITSMMRDMGYTEAEYFDGTQLKKGIYKATGKGIDKMFADLGQEDFLKGLKTGDAYAALKVTSPVFFEKDLSHPSYPFAIKTIDSSPVNIDIFNKTFRTFGENQGIEGRSPKEGQLVTEGFGVTTTTKPSFKIKQDIDLNHPSSIDLSGALGQYESVQRTQSLNQKSNAQYRIESGKNIIEALREFNKAKDKGKAVVAITHEIMHPTVVEIISGAKDGNEIGKKYTQTIVDEFNKSTGKNITVDELITGNDEFKGGKTTKQYRDVQEFIAESWEKYHTQGAKGFSTEFQKVLENITEAFKTVYKSLTGKELTPELRKMFDDILGKSEFKYEEATKEEGAKIVSISEPPTKTPTEVNIPEGADENYIKMANVVNDAFVGNKFGLEALDQITSKLEDTNLENVIQKVKDKVKLNPKLAKETRERLLTTKQGNEFDQAVLMYDLAELKGRENALQKEILNTTNPEKIQELQNGILQVQNEMMDNALANRNIGRSASTIFRLRQLWVNKDLTIVDMMDQYKASKGVKELTPEQEQEVKNAYEQLKESKSKLEEAKSDLEKSREETAKLMIENQKLKEFQDKASETKKAERAEKTSETIKKSNERVAKSLENLRKLGGQSNVGFDPKIAVELSRIAAEKVYQGIVKFDELVQNVLDEIKGVLPNFTKEDVVNHLLTKKNKAGDLEPMLLSAEYNNIKKSLSKSEGTLREKVKKYELAQKEVAKQQFKWQEERRQDMMSNQPLAERIGDKILRFQRFAVLSYPSTFVKLAAVVGHGILLKPLRFGIGKFISALTPKSIKEKQSIWGDPKWSSLGKYYSEWVKNFSLTNLKEVMSGVDTKELLYGRPIMYDELNASGSLMELPGRSHGYIKSFIKNPEFAYAHEQQMVFNLTKMAEITEKLSEPNLTKKQKKELQDEYDNYDVTNEDVIERINKLSFEHSKWAILMNDNKFVDKFRQFTQSTGLLGKIAQSELPIVKIPVNFMGRAFAIKYGLIRAIMGKSETETSGRGKVSGLGGTSFPGIAKMLYKGTEGLTEAQADLLGKALQLGTLGAAFYALGYLNKDKIKKNEDGSYEFFGQHVSKNLVHVPEYESLLSGAETAHRQKEKSESFLKSYIIADAEIAANNPFINLLKYGAIPKLGMLLGDIADPKKKDVDFAGKSSDIIAKKIADMIQPGFMKQIATSYDTKEGKGFYPMGETIKRYPAGEISDRFWQQFELGVPGLRKNVPTEAQSADIKKVMKDMKGKQFEESRGKIIKTLKKIPY